MTTEKDFIKYYFISDLHGFYVDMKALSCVVQAITEHPIDVLYINGDLLDLPWMMGKDKHKFTIEDDHLTVDEEIDYTVVNILKPLRKAVGKKVPIIFKPGNHEDRLLRINANNTTGLREMVMAGLKRDRMSLTSMLQFKELGITLDRGDKQHGVDTDVTFLQKRKIGDRGAITHGYLTSQSRLKKYLETFQCSGTSGHTHTMKREMRPWVEGDLVWQESGCLCRKVGVSFFPLGKPSLWTHGFVTMWRNKYDGMLFTKGHEIQDYTLEFKGQIFTPKSYA